MEEQKEKIIGNCSCCLEVQILDSTKRGRAKFLPEYRDHYIELDNGQLMRVGVCTQCKSGLVQGKNVLKLAKKIWKNHQEFWDRNLPDFKERNPASQSTFKDWKIADPNTSVEKHRKKRGDEPVEQPFKK